jgi:type II secretory pathway pseudopilin PulG
MPDRDDDFDDRPRRRRFEDEDDAERPRRPSGGMGGGVIALIIGGVLLAGLCVVGLLVALLLPAVSRVREAAARVQTSNNLKQIGLAMHNYHGVNGHFPLPALKTRDGRPGLSWRVAILPYIEQESLYRQFKLDEPWDSPANRQAARFMPKPFLSVGDPEGTDLTHFRVFVGGGAMFEWDKKTGLGPETEQKAGLGDGSQNTIMVIEAAEAVPWSKPEELEYDPRRPLPALGPSFRDLFLVLLADGSVRPFNKGGLNETTLRAAITRNGGEVMPPDW